MSENLKRPKIKVGDAAVNLRTDCTNGNILVGMGPKLLDRFGTFAYDLGGWNDLPSSI